MTIKRDIAVTLTQELYDRLRAESGTLDVPLEWLVASLVLDTLESDCVQPTAF
jgi:hypothetical protein